MTSIFEVSPRCKELQKKLIDFVENDCLPAEEIYESQVGTGDQRWKTVPPIMEELKAKAKSLGLWNLFLHKGYKEGPGLSNLEYATLCEISGRCPRIAPEAMNCSAPDTGNMEVFAKYGTPAQKAKYLAPLMNGEIRSAFAMTEYAVSSSDATNIETSIERVGDHYIINGRKWWISGAGDPRCKVYLVMGKTDPKNENKHRQQSIVIVPSDTPGLEVVRPMTVFGYDDAPEGHCEVKFTNVRVPVENIIAGEGRGFEVIQGRLGPGRIHHCMRAIGMAERSLDTMIARVTDPSRRTFGRILARHGTVAADVAKIRIEINAARLMVLAAADKIDKLNAKGALRDIAMAKVLVPNMLQKTIDLAIQAHGAAGVSQDFPLARFAAGARTLRIADGPDEVHIQQLARFELMRGEEIRERNKAIHNRRAQILDNGSKL
ncbi:acyl-CoA dehydrogenase [Entomortierella parvispora]|uniref:Acyl-CoA dehydrogenase n=1 Tax=Entomortierella parvispora TaxID=205924 RepID=A0A9P3LUL4_9FUNG|nr:acyl-CoA dehydrogenase [Entomortierella parvispora]